MSDNRTILSYDQIRLEGAIKSLDNDSQQTALRYLQKLKDLHGKELK